MTLVAAFGMRLQVQMANDFGCTRQDHRDLGTGQRLILNVKVAPTPTET